MKAISMMVGFTVGVVALMCVLPVSAVANDDHEMIRFYESCIVAEIDRCEAKAALLDSQSQHLRQYARLKTQKASFLAQERDGLIEEMIENEINLNLHSVAVYLNKRFYDEID